MRMGWRKAVVQYIESEARPVDRFGHQPRLYALACTIGRGLTTTMMSFSHPPGCMTLAYLLGTAPNDPEASTHWDHVPYTIHKVRSLLPTWGFPPAKLHAVEEVIRTHQPQDARSASRRWSYAIGFPRAVGRDTVSAGGGKDWARRAISQFYLFASWDPFCN